MSSVDPIDLLGSREVFRSQFGITPAAPLFRHNVVASPASFLLQTPHPTTAGYAAAALAAAAAVPADPALGLDLEESANASSMLDGAACGSNEREGNVLPVRRPSISLTRNRFSDFSSSFREDIGTIEQQDDVQDSVTAALSSYADYNDDDVIQVVDPSHTGSDEQKYLDPPPIVPPPVPVGVSSSPHNSKGRTPKMPSIDEKTALILPLPVVFVDSVASLMSSTSTVRPPMFNRLRSNSLPSLSTRSSSDFGAILDKAIARQDAGAEAQKEQQQDNDANGEGEEEGKEEDSGIMSDGLDQPESRCLGKRRRNLLADIDPMPLRRRAQSLPASFTILSFLRSSVNAGINAQEGHDVDASMSPAPYFSSSSSSSFSSSSSSSLAATTTTTVASTTSPPIFPMSFPSPPLSLPLGSQQGGGQSSFIASPPLQDGGGSCGY